MRQSLLSSSGKDPGRQRPGRGAPGFRRLRQQGAAEPRSCGRLERRATARELGCSRGLGNSPVTDGTGACSVPELRFGGVKGVGRGRRHKAPSPRPSLFDRPLRCQLKLRPWGCPSGTGPPSRALLKHVCVCGGVSPGWLYIDIYTDSVFYVCVCLYMKAVCVCWIFLGASTQIQRFRHLCCMCVIYGLLRYIYKGTRVHIGCTFNKMCMVFQILEAPRPPACPFSSSPRLPFTLFSACGTRPGLPRRHTPHSLCLLRCVSQRLRRLPIPLVRAASSSERPQEQHSRLPPAPSRTKRARAGKWQEPSASPCIAPSQRLV